MKEIKDGVPHNHMVSVARKTTETATDNESPVRKLDIKLGFLSELSYFVWPFVPFLFAVLPHSHWDITQYLGNYVGLVSSALERGMKVIRHFIQSLLVSELACRVLLKASFCGTNQIKHVVVGCSRFPWVLQFTKADSGFSEVVRETRPSLHCKPTMCLRGFLHKYPVT